MIYQINNYGEIATFLDSNEDPNAEQKAKELLEIRKAQVLEQQKVRFSICATFETDKGVLWREVRDDDPEETLCQVFDTYTGKYTEVSSKTEAYILNQKKKEEFLESIGLHKVFELESMPEIPSPD